MATAGPGRDGDPVGRPPSSRLHAQPVLPGALGAAAGAAVRRRQGMEERAETSLWLIRACFLLSTLEFGTIMGMGCIRKPGLPHLVPLADKYPPTHDPNHSKSQWRKRRLVLEHSGLSAGSWKCLKGVEGMDLRSRKEQEFRYSLCQW